MVVVGWLVDQSVGSVHAVPDQSCPDVIWQWSLAVPHCVGWRSQSPWEGLGQTSQELGWKGHLQTDPAQRNSLQCRPSDSTTTYLLPVVSK